MKDLWQNYKKRDDEDRFVEKAVPMNSKVLWHSDGRGDKWARCQLFESHTQSSTRWFNVKSTLNSTQNV